jgi:hypothetical protein
LENVKAHSRIFGTNLHKVLQTSIRNRIYGDFGKFFKVSFVSGYDATGWPAG